MTAYIVEGLEFAHPVAHGEDRTARNCDRGRISGFCEFVRECGEHPGIPEQPIILDGEEITARIRLGRQSVGNRLPMPQRRKRCAFQDVLQRPAHTPYLDYRRCCQLSLEQVATAMPA